jgi:hypothetical protein
MGILLGFAPFIAFAILDWAMGPTQGLIAGALVSLALLLRDWFILKHVPKVLEIGTTILFGGLALYAVSGAPTWSIIGVRLRVDHHDRRARGRNKIYGLVSETAAY